MSLHPTNQRSAIAVHLAPGHYQTFEEGLEWELGFGEIFTGKMGFGNKTQWNWEWDLEKLEKKQ